MELNRPEALNALNLHLIREVISRLHEADADNNIKAVVLTGSIKSFAGQIGFDFIPLHF